MAGQVIGEERLDTGDVVWDELAGVVVENYGLCAPKSLARAIDA